MLTVTKTETAQATVEQVKMVEDYDRMRREAKALEARMDALKKTLEASMPEGAKSLVSEGRKLVNRSKKTRTGLDTKSLKAAAPEVYEAFKTETTYTSTTVYH